MTKPNPEHRIEICHKGETITVDYAGALNHARVHPEDIVPAFDDFPGPFPGQNIGESCSLATTTTTLPTPTTLPSTTSTVLSTTTTAPTTLLTTTTAKPATTITTTLQETPTPTLVTTTTTTEAPLTSAQVVVPSPVVRETLPVTGIGTPGLILVAGVLIAAGVGLVRKAKR